MASSSTGCREQEQDLPPATARRRGHGSPPPCPAHPSTAVPVRVYQRRKNLKPAEEMPPGGGGEQDTPPRILRPPVLHIYQEQDLPPATTRQHTPPCILRPPVRHVYQTRKKLRQLKAQQAAASILEDTLAGFFHHQRYNKQLKFHNLSGRGPPMVDPDLPFLRGRYSRFTVEQCCNGLLLCKCWESQADRDDWDLVVWNPATEKWTVLPPFELLDEEDDEPVYFKPVDVFLAFDDTAIHARFVVLVTLGGRLNDLAIYSSENGRWMRGGLEDEAVPVVSEACVFLNGCMHLRIEEPCIAAVDMEGKVLNRIPLPEETEDIEEDIEPRYGDTSMGLSQGLLHSWYTNPAEADQLYVWVLEDYENEEWTLKDTVNLVKLFGMECVDRCCEMFAIHPERNVIYITNGKDRTVSYNMDNKEANVICTSGEFLDGLPYIPCFGDWLSDGQQCVCTLNHNML